MTTTTAMDVRIELVPVPVTDIDRAKAFYVDGLGSTRITTTGCTRRCGSCS